MVASCAAHGHQIAEKFRPKSTSQESGKENDLATCGLVLGKRGDNLFCAFAY